MDNEYPRMLYRFGGDVQLQDGLYSTSLVDSDDEKAQALADGWFVTSGEARDAYESAKAAELAAAQAAADAQAAEELARLKNAESAPPTRAELEQKAADMGMRVDGRWSDKKLLDMITANLEA